MPNQAPGSGSASIADGVMNRTSRKWSTRTTTIEAAPITARKGYYDTPMIIVIPNGDTNTPT